MGNSIKYTTGAESNSLKKGNFRIGTGDVGKGPTSTTGFYKATAPSSGGYRIYLYNNNVSGDIAYHTVANDSELISFTNSLAGQSYTTVNQCLTYYTSQTDKVCFNREYEGIVTDGLVLNLDAGFTPSYPRSGTTWGDISLSGNNGTLTNGPTFSTDGGGSIVFDGVDDYIVVPTITNSVYSIDFWYKMNGNDGSYGYFASSGLNGFAISEGGTAGGLSFGKLYYWQGTANILADIPSTTNWNHICAVINTSTNSLQLYGNSINLNNPTITSMSTSVSNIGRFVNSNNNFLKGNLSTYKIYNRALTSTEVLQNYNAQKGRFGL